jgi:uncharacterized membrane protein YdbT with pleckstrin-like domain
MEGSTLSVRLHWAVFLGPAAVFVFGGLSLRAKGLSALVLLAVGVLWGILVWGAYRRSEITLTNDRVRVRTGYLMRRDYDILFTDIAVVDFYQPSLGTLLNFGKLIIVHGKGTRTAVRMVAAPLEFVMELKRRVGRLYGREQELS